jgi:glycosyltransferase involved in cell wall biosynthesis
MGKSRKNNILTIVTPAYNRADRLPALYNSLIQQSNQKFNWLVVDDGSIDDTKLVVEKMQQEEEISVYYINKENGGKHTAINVAINYVATELFFIVDSDDVLTEDAVETILRDWSKVRKHNLCGIGYLRGYDSKKVIGDLFTKDGLEDTFINERYNRGVNGDKAEVWVTKCLKEAGGFPEYSGEKFISESVLWIKLARRRKMLFRNKIIYITEYLPGGLSDSGRTLRFRCPHLMAYGSLETMSKEFSMKIRLKETLLYIVYCKFGHWSLKRILECPYKILVLVGYLPGLLLYHYWKKKYV